MRHCACLLALSLSLVALSDGSPVGAQGTVRRRPAPPNDNPGREAAIDANVDREPASAVRLFEGISTRGSVQEALDHAVAEALRSLPGADRMVRYRVREITGESGGIRGANSVRVIIELNGDAPLPVPRPDRPVRDLSAREISRALALDLRLRPASVPRGGEATFELTVRNSGNQLVTLPFTSAKQFDFEVLKAGKLVARWSNRRVFAQALSSATIGPGQSLTYTGRWDLRNLVGQPVPAGDYLVRGLLTPSLNGVRLADEATLRVTSR